MVDEKSQFKSSEMHQNEGFLGKSRENLDHRIYRTENWGKLQDFTGFCVNFRTFTCKILMFEFQIYRILQDYRTSGSPATSPDGTFRQHINNVFQILKIRNRQFAHILDSNHSAKFQNHP